jgi:hypothetical protein
VWEDDLREAGSCSNPRTRPNWTQHDTRSNGPKEGVAAPLAEKDLCTKIMIAAGSKKSFDAYERRLQELSRNICTPESKSIRGRGGRHKLLLF